VSWSRAAALALIPWALFLVLLVPYLTWDGMLDHYGWMNFTKRMISVAVTLYCAFAVALRMRGRI